MQPSRHTPRLGITAGAKAFAVAAGWALLAAGCVTSPSQATPASDGTGAFDAVAALQYSGSQEPLAQLRQAISSAGQDMTRLSAIERELAGLLERPDTTYAGRQAICENLGRLYAVTFSSGKPTIPPVLVAMLADDTQVDLARMALERAPGTSVDEVFAAGLGRSAGRVRIALIQSIGNRRIASAVPALAGLLGDASTAPMAAKALGQIGDEAAYAALAKSPDPNAAWVVEARLGCLRSIDRTRAVAWLEEVSANASIASPQRAAALSALMAIDPEGAPRRVAAILGGRDSFLKQSVVSWLATTPRQNLIPVIISDFKSWDCETQVGVVVAAGRMGDPALLPLVVEAAQSDREGLKIAAIASLGQLPGNSDIALLLARASQESGSLAAQAKQTLARLNGPGIDEMVFSGARQKDNPLRPVFLEALALRNVAGASELFMEVRGEPDLAIRCTALDGLALVCPATLQTPLLDWMVSSKEATEQSHALRAAAAATYRNPDEAARLRPIAVRIEGTPSGSVQKMLLLVLARAGGPQAAGYVARFALQHEGPAGDAAVYALGRWNDKSALGPLTSLAEKASTGAFRSRCVRAAIASLPQNPWELSGDDRRVIARLRAVTLDPVLLGRLDALENPPAK